MIQELKEIFNSKAWRWNERELGNLEFLRRDRDEWGNIKVTCLGIKTGHILASKDKIVFSLLKYSRNLQECLPVYRKLC